MDNCPKSAAILRKKFRNFQHRQCRENPEIALENGNWFIIGSTHGIFTDLMPNNVNTSLV